MNHRNQPSYDHTSEVDWNNAFRAQAIRTIPAIPVVTSVGFVGGSGRQRAVRTPHWLSRFVTCPAPATATEAGGAGATDNRWAKHIADRTRSWR